MSRRSELKTLLTGRKVVFTETNDKYRQEVTPYDQSSTDVPYILRMMMFYEAAGAERYTGLWNAYQGFVDLSTLLGGRSGDPGGPSAGRRTGEIPRRHAAPRRPAAGGTQNKHVTMYRFVFPVKKEKSGEWRVGSSGQLTDRAVAAHCPLAHCPLPTT